MYTVASVVNVMVVANAYELKRRHLRRRISLIRLTLDSIYIYNKNSKIIMSRLRLRRKWQDSYACRRQFFLFIFFLFGMILFFKVLKIVHEQKHRDEFHKIISQHLDHVLSSLNQGEEDIP